MTNGTRVKLHGCDQRGRDLTGMTATIVDCGVFYATVAVFAWGGEVVTVLSSDCQPLDPEPVSVAEWKRIHLSWAARNRRVIRRMQRRMERAA